MKSMVRTKVSGIETVKIEETQVPTPDDNQVLIEVKASTLTGIDVMKKAEKVPGAEVAGIVAAVGYNVTHLKRGDKVFGSTVDNKGGWAEYALVDRTVVEHMPCNLSFETAAAIPMAGITALGAIRKSNVREGKTVLVYGASGGVGQFAVQLAKAAGAIVTGVCSTRNIEMARLIGADFVIDYKQEDFTEIDKTYDAIIGVNGYNSLRTYKKLLNPEGTYVAVGGILQGAMGLFGGLVALGSSKTMTFSIFANAAKQPCLSYLKDLAESNKLKPFIENVYSIQDVSLAIESRQKTHAQGKIVLTMDW